MRRKIPSVSCPISLLILLLSAGSVLSDMVMGEAQASSADRNFIRSPAERTEAQFKLCARAVLELTRREQATKTSPGAGAGGPVKLHPGGSSAPIASPVWADLASSLGETTPQTLLVSSRAELVEVRTRALDYLLRHGEEIRTNLREYPQAEERDRISLALSRLTTRSLPSLTYAELMEGIVAMMVLRSSMPARRRFGVADFDAKLRELHLLWERGFIVLPIFEAEPMTQERILRLQAALILPVQVIETPREADRNLLNAFRFFEHDMAHASLIQLVGDLHTVDYGVLLARGPGRTSWLAALASRRERQLEDFLRRMPGVTTRDRQYVVRILFQAFHEQEGFGRYNFLRDGTPRGLPTDLEVLARQLRLGGDFYLNDTAHNLHHQLGIPVDSAQRILLAIRDAYSTAP